MAELFACRVSDFVTVVSGTDYIIAKKLLKPRRLDIIPNFVAYEIIERTLKKRSFRRRVWYEYVVYHGDFRYFPNREALLNMLKHIMPEIWKDYPNIKLVLIGPGIPRFEGIRIKSLGFLPQEELYAVISGAVCAIVPLLRGGGTRIKILEYMTCGVPVISTETGAEGLDVENFKHIILVRNVEEIPSVFKTLIGNTRLREELTRNAIALVRNKYDAQKVVAKLARICESLINQRRDPYG